MTTVEVTGEAAATGTLRSRIQAVASYLGACIWGGLAAGLLIGGIGSRLAMFVLRITSGETVIGLESDDGFTIGGFTSDSIFLVLLSGAVGVAACLLYGLVRVWIPPRWRALSFGLLGGLVGGAAIVHEDGIDFFLLEPRWLAVAMFVALPLLGAVTLSLVTERMMRRVEERSISWIWLAVPLPAFLLGGPLGIALIVSVAIGLVLEPKVPLIRWWQSAPVTWLGRTALLAWGIAGAIALVNDIRAIADLPA